MFDISSNIKALQKLPKPQAIIFDWDNTLVDTWPLIQKALNVAMENFLKPTWTLEQVRDNVHKSMRDYFPEIFGDNWQEAGEIYRNAYNAINIEQIQLLPNALELIKTLKDAEILQFLVSNKIGTTLRKEVKKLQIEQYFFSAIGALDANFDKPHQSAIDLALMLSDIDLKKDCIWFVGDTISDVECAYNTRCHPIIYGHSSHKISNSISQEILENGFNNSGIIPLYFNHQELISVIKNLL